MAVTMRDEASLKKCTRCCRYCFDRRELAEAGGSLLFLCLAPGNRKAVTRRTIWKKPILLQDGLSLFVCAAIVRSLFWG